MKKSAKKGRCLKWSKGRTRCMKRAKSAAPKKKSAKKGRCLKWSKGRTRCMKRAKR